MDAPLFPYPPQNRGVIYMALRRKFTLFMMAAACAAAARGQETLATVKVYTKPAGVMFRVDGQLFRSSAAFTWPAGSRHTLSADAVQEGAQFNTRFTLNSWMTTGEVPVQGNAPTVTVTADPSRSFFRADYGVEYTMDLLFSGCGDGAAACSSPGKVYAGGQEYTHDARIWMAAGSTLDLQAVPAPGYVFLGWQDAAGNVIQGLSNKVTVKQPTAAYARFQLARSVQLTTSPAGLQLLIDRAPITTPQTLEWGYDSVHTLAPISPQDDGQGRAWVFQSWSDGRAATHAYKVPPASGPALLSANFVPGARMTFLTSPQGLKLRIDGRDNWYGSYSFTWGVGETHRAEAPAEQTDAQGRKYTFKGWSNGAAAAHDVAVGDAEAASGLRETAVYERMGRLSVQSSIAGLPVMVDGAECPTPCVLDRPAGAQVRLAASANLPAGDGSRHVFQGWNDAGAAERAFTFGSEAVELIAAYRLEHRLVAAADPPDGARWKCDPQSNDGFYDAQSQVSVRVEARPGYRFRRMEGDMAGAYSSGVVTMTAPRYVRAVFDRVPYIAPAGVRNAAAETPVDAVAPGSVISILGASLAPNAETGPDSPLVQTLAGGDGAAGRPSAAAVLRFPGADYGAASLRY